MRVLLFLWLFPFMVFAQGKKQEMASVFKDFVIESDNNLFTYKQDLGLLDADISPEEQKYIKELHKVKSDYFQLDYKVNLKPLHRNPLLYEAREYQMMGSEGMFYSNILGGLVETFFGELTFKL